MESVVHLFLILLCISDICSQNTSSESPSTSGVNTPTTGVNQACSIIVLGKKTKQNFDSLLNSKNTKLVKINFSFQNASSGPLAGLSETNIFLPLTWTKTKGSEGRGLLLLKEELISLSFSALSFGVENFDVSIAEDPPQCFVNQNLNVSHLQSKLRDLVLGDLDPTQMGESPEGHRVCNQHIRDNGWGVAEFYYICCYRGEDGKLQCSELSEDIWLFVFFRIMMAINILVVLYSPLLVPERWYREKYVNLVYTHTLNKEVKVKILKTAVNTQPLEFRPKNRITFYDLDSDPDMNKFKEHVSDLRENQPYIMTVSKLIFKMKADRLIPANHVPVGVFRTLYDTIVKCGVRERYAVKDCCYSNMFGTIKPCRKTILWHHCLEKFMTILLLILLAVPWALRLYFYYIYEDTNRYNRRTAAEAHGLKPDYPGNLLAYFNPIHGIFLFCYAILFFDMLLFGVLEKKVTERSRYVVRKCFRDMRGMNRSQAIGYCIFTLLIPIKKFGVFFLLIAWIYWALAIPVLLLVIAFYFMPLVNIMCRLIFNNLEIIIPIQKCFNPVVRAYHRLYKEDYSIPIPIFVEDHVGTPRRPRSGVDKAVNMLITLLLIISIISFTVLALEFLIIVVEYLVYQFIGLVLNWGVWMKYVTLAFILIIYAKDSFGSVTQRYLTFNERLVAYLKSKVDEQIKEIILRDPNDQGNTAFQIDADSDADQKVEIDVDKDTEPTIPTDVDRDPEQEFQLSVRDSHLEWQMPRVVLFLDNADISYVTKHLFFEVSNMPNAGCPGSLMTNLFTALSQVTVILLFLLFVLLVIAAFGEKYEVSGVNQTVLAAAGGILPFVFKKILFKSPPGFDLDTSSPKFQNAFNKVLRHYREYAFMYDIELAGTPEECSDQSEIDLLVDTNDPTTRNSLLMTNV
jgi:hypothetical protein